MSNTNRTRLLVDVSTLVGWSGPPAGIARVEHALAMAARDRPGCVLCCYDPSANAFRALSPAWRDVLLGWSGAIDTHTPTVRRGPRALLPGRQRLVAALERLRLTTRSRGIAAASAAAQVALLALRPHRFPLHGPDGARIANVPRDLALGEDLLPGPGDIVLGGPGWLDRDAADLAGLVRRAGFAYRVLCYDLIPLTHARFYPPEIVRRFATYWRTILPVTGRAIVNAGCIAADLRGFCRTEGLACPEIRECVLGFDPPATQIQAPLPAGLRQGGYVLFVSTIEPRKGHAMLLRAWRRLLARGVPQRADAMLVFVGRPGWMVDEVLADLAGPALSDRVRHLSGIGQATLEALYAGAAFCVYPSIYEGFGLPVIEAFARGKAVLASSGGALPQTAAGLAPCLDPLDDAAWAARLAAWLDDPAAVARAAARIAAEFDHPAWPLAATALLDAAEA